MTVTEFLKDRVPFLSGLTEDQSRALANAAAQLACKKGQTILFKGVTVDGLHVVAAGKVSVWVKPDKTKPLAQVAQLSPGEVFGETSIIEMSTAGATVKAEEDGTLIFVLPQDAFRCILDQNPDFKARALALIAARKAVPPPKPA
jgi:CRP-like cAMP-binding protein